MAAIPLGLKNGSGREPFPVDRRLSHLGLQRGVARVVDNLARAAIDPVVRIDAAEPAHKYVVSASHKTWSYNEPNCVALNHMIGQPASHTSAPGQLNV